MHQVPYELFLNQPPGYQPPALQQIPPIAQQQQAVQRRTTINNQKFTDEETETLLDIIGDLVPKCKDEWGIVENRFNAAFPRLTLLAENL
jgi:hypothetical protein